MTALLLSDDRSFITGQSKSLRRSPFRSWSLAERDFARTTGQSTRYFPPSTCSCPAAALAVDCQARRTRLGDLTVQCQYRGWRRQNGTQAAVVDGQAERVARDAVRQALQASGTDVSTALLTLGWPDLLYADEAWFYTTIFEEQGYLGVCTNALDIVTAATLGLDGRAAFVWPLAAGATAVDMGGSGMVLVEGALLRSQLRTAANLLCPVSGRLTSLRVSSFAEQHLPQELATFSPWVRAKIWGYPAGDIAPWQEIQRPARLAIASEFVGAARRIIDDAITRTGASHLPGLGCESEETPSSLAGAVAEVASVKELIAAGWVDGSTATEGSALIGATGANEALSQRARAHRDGLDPGGHHPFGPFVSSVDCRYGASTSLHDRSRPSQRQQLT
jgi:hypothetical protein